MSRTRSLTRSIPIPACTTYWGTGSQPVTQNAIPRAAGSTWVEHSLMNDSISRAVRVKPVQHVKLEWHPGVIQDYTIAELNNYRESTRPPTLHSSPLLVQTVLNDFVPNPSSAVLGGLADEAFYDFATQVPQEVDVANFLLDFREIGALIPKLQENMFKTVGGGFLSYQFGWKPMIGDLQKLGALASTVATRLEWLRSTFGKRVRLGFSASIDMTSMDNAVFPKISADRKYSLLSSGGQFRANGTLYHELKGLDRMEGTLRGMVAALGLNSPSRVLWERVPWSFVVDWLARTKRVSESLTFQPFSGLWNVSNVSSSTTFQRVIEARVNSAYPSANQVMGTFKVKCYTRYKSLPVSSSIFFNEELTPQQTRLAAALVAGAVR